MALRYPIVLVHGLNGFDQWRLDLGRWPLVRIEYFRAIAARLRAVGVPAVHAAVLPPRGSIVERAAALAAYVEREVAAPRFHLVAHSMGGLDARHYLTHLGGAARGALSLTTLATPHRGSPLAAMLVDSLFAPCLRVTRRLRLERLLRYTHSKSAGHHDLRPAACTAFNTVTPDVPGVAYFSWAGAPPQGAVQWPLRLTWGILLRGPEGGPNDGMVTVDSARWSGWRGCVPADHISLVGWQITAASRRCFCAGDFYIRLLADLAPVEAAEKAGDWRLEAGGTLREPATQ